MQEILIEFFQTNREAAVVISLGLNILISVLGVVPSFFLTAANLAVFGLVEGTLVSFLGEALGAAVTFLLYRKGFKRYANRKLTGHKYVEGLLKARGIEAFYLILGLRILPFIPSGLVTLAAAIGEVSLSVFVVASSIGKLPALIIEAYSIYQVAAWTVQGKVILLIFSLLLVFFALKRIGRKDE